MKSKQMFSDASYFGEYETVIRKEIGKELDDVRNLISQIENRCTARIMNIDIGRPDKGTPITVENLVSCDKEYRCKTLSTLLYNDALWRLEAAHLMMCVGLLNVAYTNLRTSLEFLETAFIVERCDEEAFRFLRNEEVNLKLMEKLLINPEYSTHLKKLKESYALLGVHRFLSSLQLSSLFGASRFDKYVTERTKTQRTLELPDRFAEAAEMCTRQGEQVGILFMWLESLPATKQDA